MPAPHVAHQMSTWCSHSHHRLSCARLAWRARRRMRIYRSGSFLMMKATFHFAGKVNRHNIPIPESPRWDPAGAWNPQSERFFFLVPLPGDACVVHSFFWKDSVTGTMYPDVMENWLTPQFTDEREEQLFCQQDRPPLNGHVQGWEHLNGWLPGRGCAATLDNIFCTWPPHSSDPTVYDFFLWGFVKNRAYVPSLQKC